MASLSDFPMNLNDIEYDTRAKIKMYPGKYGFKPKPQELSDAELFELNCTIDVSGELHKFKLHFISGIVDQRMKVTIDIDTFRQYSFHFHALDMYRFVCKIINKLVGFFMSDRNLYGKVLVTCKQYYKKNRENQDYFDMFVGRFVTDGE